MHSPLSPDSSCLWIQLNDVIKVMGNGCLNILINGFNYYLVTRSKSSLSHNLESSLGHHR